MISTGNPTARHPMAVAAFDFDGTLSYRDTLLPFLAHVSGVVGLGRALLIASPVLFAFVLGKVSNEVAKERLTGIVLKGRDDARLRKMAASWVSRIALRPDAIERLQWHQAQGHRCVMVSASPDIYLESMARLLGFDDLLCSKLEVGPDGRLTGRLGSANCWGDEKVRRLKELLGPLGGLELYAYGDSKGDLPMLKSSRFAWFKGKPMVENDFVAE